MEIYIIRHGETPWNAKGLLQGSIDMEINEKGRLLAIECGQNLDHLDFDVIFSSPLLRAYETACLIRGRKNIPILRDERLKEISFGDMEGEYYGNWKDDVTSPYYAFFNDPGNYTPPPHGETFDSAIRRATDFLKNEVETKSYQRIMIVAHGALNKALMCYMENHGADQYWGEGLQKNCQATVYIFENGGYRRLSR